MAKLLFKTMFNLNKTGENLVNINLRNSAAPQVHITEATVSSHL